MNEFINMINTFSYEELVQEKENLIAQIAQMVANDDAIIKLEMIENELSKRKENIH